MLTRLRRMDAHRLDGVVAGLEAPRAIDDPNRIPVTTALREQSYALLDGDSEQWCHLYRGADESTARGPMAGD